MKSSYITVTFDQVTWNKCKLKLLIELLFKNKVTQKYKIVKFLTTLCSKRNHVASNRFRKNKNFYLFDPDVSLTELRYLRKSDFEHIQHIVIELLK